MSSDSLLGARKVRELLDEHGVRPRKALGQNFVIDPNTIRKMVALAQVGPDDAVIEVGAGAGSLTLALTMVARRVVAFEKDPKLIPVLEQVLEGRDNVEIVQGDALEHDLGAVDAEHLVANLPYNVAATVVLRALEAAPGIASLTVMTQREVGERLAAGAGSKTYGLSSVLAAYFAEARVVTRVSRRAFWPEPNVDSVIVRLVRRPRPAVPQDVFFAIARAGFAQRRKMLRGSLRGVVDPPDRLDGALSKAGIDPTIRAEELDHQGFVALAEHLRPFIAKA
ncbi:MAG: 16S rRNA (adenine(1518)-N(6)/adenine(1519)-N(6))-dimethyltransferase RsmA [Actinomycetota bacterium]|nr:16S rRNA (adenine(1518)-N(6)/adenine(1519)-N(6))-dimethyltransferase RsmA [Actinomycetota bacterium]